jgi:hypothetical protein
MRKIINFFKREIVNTIMLVLTVIFAIAGLIGMWQGNPMGCFYPLLVLFILRTLMVHYDLWDKVNAYVTDDEVRVNVFGLPRKSYTGGNKQKAPLFYRVFGWIMLLIAVLMIGYLFLALIGVIK